MDGGSTGAGAVEDQQQQQQQKPGLKLTSRLSALYDNLLNKKKDKPAPVDEESATATKEPTQESSSPTKPVLPAGEASSEPPTSDKKPEDIVYAELDLARSGGGNGPNPEIVVRGSDDKTEYAEIVGVVAAGQIDEKKSPSASNKSGGSATEK
ncbi:unnamed protein product [Orchesella dallaii]|uniref:Uncharacterized protein n=1 Tax=Orchesella dallaii TaxID=48710 RepID=A0ABP1Q716_9HEXA